MSTAKRPFIVWSFDAVFPGFIRAVPQASAAVVATCTLKAYVVQNEGTLGSGVAVVWTGTTPIKVTGVVVGLLSMIKGEPGFGDICMPMVAVAVNVTMTGTDTSVVIIFHTEL